MTMKSQISILAVLLVVLSVAVGGVAAQDTYTVSISSSDAGTASSIGVDVDGVDQSHDLVSDGDFETTLEAGAVVTLTHSGGSESTYTVGDGDATITVSDASASYTESVADTGGAGDGSNGDSGESAGWLTQAVVSAIIIGIVLSWLGINRGGGRR